MTIKNVISATALICLACSASPVSAVNYFITFGDSYSQTGFDVSSTKPSASNPLGNPAYPGYTTSGGANWIGDLVEKYNASVTYSYNFADGGATVNASLVAPYQPTVKSLIDQVKQFSGSIASKPTYAPWSATNSVFGIWLGVNDVGNSYSATDAMTRTEKVMDSYFSQVDILLAAGARNFVFLNVPPINKSPLMLGQSVSAQSTEATVISHFNELLSNRTAAFAAANQGVKGLVVDTQAPFNTAIENPSKYGSKDSTCYNANGKTCLWYNNYHPGLAIQDLVAQAVVAAYKDDSFFKAA